MHRITDKIGAKIIDNRVEVIYAGYTCIARCSACATHGWTGQSHHMAIYRYICIVDS